MNAALFAISPFDAGLMATAFAPGALCPAFMGWVFLHQRAASRDRGALLNIGE